MTDTRRSDLRVANAIHNQLLLLRRRPMGLWPTGTGRILERMYELLDLQRKVEMAMARRLPNAAQRLKAKWDGVLQQLMCVIQELANRKGQTSQDVPSLADLLQDLDQIRRHFGGFDYFGDESMLAVSTPSITLQGLDLGRFRIELNVLSLGRRTNKNVFEIRTLDLHCATSNGGVCHPHVLYGHLNARAFAEPIRQARLAGRIVDLFQLVVQSLQSYDESVAYVRIADWHKAFCSQCHRELPEGQRTFCEGCDEYCCEGCSVQCPQCGKRLCPDCQSICQLCGKILCSHCISGCATCGADACQDCLQTGLCPSCAQEWAKPA